MDEDRNNKYMADEHERLEREAKGITRGCGLLALVVAVVVGAILIIYKFLSV